MKMKKLLILCLLAALPAVYTSAQKGPSATDETAFRGTISNEEYQVWIEMDFYDPHLTIPDQELLGEVAGYLGAKRDPRKWIITSAKLADKHTAQLEIINDYGSEDLTATLTLQPDGTYMLRQTGGSTIKIAVNRKWVKLPKTLIFKRKQ